MIKIDEPFILVLMRVNLHKIINSKRSGLWHLGGLASSWLGNDIFSSVRWLF